MNKGNTWSLFARGAIVLSILSLFLPVITYTNAAYVTRSFNILGIIFDPSFSQFVFWEYAGDFMRGTSFGAMWMLAAVLGMLGVAAIIFAFAGISSMTKQYESNTPYHLALFGLLGTAVPAITLLIIQLISADKFLGTVRVGPYCFVTPIAMLLAMVTVTSRHKLTVEQRRIQEQAAQYVHIAGDLPMNR